MFKFETFVKTVVFTFVFSSSIANAQTPAATPPAAAPATPAAPTPAMDLRGAGEIYDRWEAKGCNQPTLPADKQRGCKLLEDMMSKPGPEGLLGCSNPTAAYDKAKSEFQGACSAIPSSEADSRAPGNVACAAALLKCNCQYKNALDPAGNDCPMTSTSNSGELIDIAAARKKFTYCPMLAGKDMAALEAELKEARKDVREAKKRIPELMDAVNEAQNQAAEKAQEAKKQMADAAKEHGKARKEARDQKDQAQGQLVEQLLQLQGEITKAEERRGNVRIQRAEAASARTKAIADIDLQCHAQASAAVTKLQEQRLALEATRQYNRGGFDQMMRAVGVSDREAWQRVAAKYFRWCVQSSPTRKLKEQANDVYEVAQKRADAEEAAIEREKADIRTRMSKIKNYNGCGGGAAPDAGGEPTESAMCRAARKAVEDQAQADRDYMIQQQQLAEQAAQAQMQGAQKAASKGAALADAQQEITDENNRLRNLAEFLNLKREKSGGRNVTDQQETEARLKFGQFLAAARNLVNCTVKDKTTPEDKYTACSSIDRGLCLESAALLGMTGDATVADLVRRYSESPEFHRRDEPGGAGRR